MAPREDPGMPRHNVGHGIPLTAPPERALIEPGAVGNVRSFLFFALPVEAQVLQLGPGGVEGLGLEGCFD